MSYIVQHHFRYKLGHGFFQHDERYDKSFLTLKEAEDYVKNDNSHVGSDVAVRREIKINQEPSYEDMKGELDLAYMSISTLKAQVTRLESENSNLKNRVRYSDNHQDEDPPHVRLASEPEMGMGFGGSPY